MKIEDVIHREHHLTSSATSIQTSVTTPTYTTKRSSSSAINAPSSKNHKNETTCTKMSDENNLISATATAIKNGLNGANISTSSSLSSSSVAASGFSVSSIGTTLAAPNTGSRIQVSRANPIHSSSNQQQNTNNTNGTTATTTTSSTTTTATSSTTTIKGRHGSVISRIKSEPADSNGTGVHCKVVGGVDGNEVVGRIPNLLSSGGFGNDSCRSVQGIGGRLQFFKDGKFILELARAKVGEKSGWISVPRKQFRSPSTTSSTVTPTYPKNESSTSLSFSDDNSSIQSSPWQRDHCWKQSTPRRGISKEMSFHFKRAKQFVVSLEGLKTARMKRRRPLDNSECKDFFRVLNNGCSIADDVEKKIEVNDNGLTVSMEDEKSSDGSSTDKEGSVRESSKTPTPESKCDSINDSLRKESIKLTENLPTKQTKIVNGEKRLKPRAKLITIIQKLIDRLPTGLFHLSKTQIISGATQQQLSHSHTNHQSLSSHHMPSTPSRVALESIHHQHVSPRKRILREFEKVSLEDTSAINSKRSRAKSNNPATVIRTLPLPTTPTSHGGVMPSSNNNYIVNGNKTDGYCNNSSSKVAQNSTPTRLFSSYSIHSLLGGNNVSNNSANNGNNVDQTVNQCSSGYNNMSYLQAMLALPKSPEGSENMKLSPHSSSTGSAKKRSPPYSQFSEGHLQQPSGKRSPIVDATYGNMRSPPEAHSVRTYVNSGGTSTGCSSRLTPPHGYLSSPKNSSNSEGYKIRSESIPTSSPNHHFYSPYMMSPKYVASPNSVSSNNPHSNDIYHPNLKGSRPSSQQNLRARVFGTQSPHSNSNHCGREPSPNSSQTGGVGMSSLTSTSTSRTVPKKTVSIRRQFASPSSSSLNSGLSEHHKNTRNSNCSNADKGEEKASTSPESRRTPTQDSSAASAAAVSAAAAISKYHQHTNVAAAAATMMQRSSPLSSGTSSLYYMFPPPNGSPSPHHSSSSQSPSPSSSYIPQINPYYHPYVSTLAALRNPLWMHHYPAAAAAAVAAAGAAAVLMPTSAAGPVTQQGMPFFPYNGAAVTTQSHLHHSYEPMHLTSAGQLDLRRPPLPASLNRSSPTTDDTISPSSIKEEHSSDIPLNLSKH